MFDGVPQSQPSLSYAYAVQRKAAKVGFDWPDVDGALPKIAEEAAEVRDAARAGDDRAPADNVALATLTGEMLDKGTAEQDKFAIAQALWLSRHATARTEPPAGDA